MLRLAEFSFHFECSHLETPRKSLLKHKKALFGQNAVVRVSVAQKQVFVYFCIVFTITALGILTGYYVCTKL